MIILDPFFDWSYDLFSAHRVLPQLSFAIFLYVCSVMLLPVKMIKVQHGYLKCYL